MKVTRRTIFKFTLAGAALLSGPWPQPPEAAEELKMPGNVPEEKFDFETKGVQGWSTVDGEWTVEGMAGAPSGKKVLVQRATKNEFNVIVAPAGPFTDVDVSMKFKPLSGRQADSGGIVVRFNGVKYYVVLVQAIEDNIR